MKTLFCYDEQYYIHVYLIVRKIHCLVQATQNYDINFISVLSLISSHEIRTSLYHLPNTILKLLASHTALVFHAVIDLKYSATCSIICVRRFLIQITTALYFLINHDNYGLLFWSR